MKQIRFLSLLLAVLLLLTLFSGCGKRGVTLDDLPETDELVIYLPQIMESFITERCIVPYRKLYPDVNVQMVIVPDENYSYDEYENRVVNDMLVGDGPDVLFLFYLFHTDMEKAAMNHSFYDLTDLLAADADFHEEDYVDHIFADVRRDGMLYMMPLSFSPSVYLSDAAKLEKLGFSWDAVDTTGGFMEEITRLTPEAAQDEAFRQMLESQNRFSYMFRASGIRLLDYEKKTVLPDEETFRAFMESYHTFFPLDYDSSGLVSGGTGTDALLRGEYLFANADLVHVLSGQINEMTAAGSKCEIGSVPGQNGERVGLVSDYIAINSTSKNVRNAYNFIKMMISEDMQKSRNGLVNYTPIHKGAIESYINGRTTLSDDETEKILRQYTQIDRFVTWTRAVVYNTMWETMLPYLQDEKSYDDCVSELKTKLNFYISE